MEKVFVKGVGIYPFTSFDQLADYAIETPAIYTSVNAEIILNADERMRKLINNNVGYCDGAGPLTALKSMGCEKAVKLAGCEFWLHLIKRFHHQKTFYLIGAKQEVIDNTVDKLKREYKDICILGYRNGYILSPSEELALLDDIEEKKPDFVFVAMGAPRQELLMEKIQERHKCVSLGLGGSFDVYAGNVKRAPKWWINHNVEWLYRLLNDPQRIGRQIILLQFAWWIFTGEFRRGAVTI